MLEIKLLIFNSEIVLHLKSDNNRRFSASLYHPCKTTHVGYGPGVINYSTKALNGLIPKRTGWVYFSPKHLCGLVFKRLRH